MKKILSLLASPLLLCSCMVAPDGTVYPVATTAVAYSYPTYSYSYPTYYGGYYPVYNNWGWGGYGYRNWNNGGCYRGGYGGWHGGYGGYRGGNCWHGQ